MSISTDKQSDSRVAFCRAYRPTSALAKDVRFDAEMMHVTLTDGRIISVPIIWFPLLREATPQTTGELRDRRRRRQPALAGNRRRPLRGGAARRGGLAVNLNDLEALCPHPLPLSQRERGVAMAVYRNNRPSSSGVTWRAMTWLACCSGM